MKGNGEVLVAEPNEIRECRPLGQLFGRIRPLLSYSKRTLQLFNLGFIYVDLIKWQNATIGYTAQAARCGERVTFYVQSDPSITSPLLVQGCAKLAALPLLLNFDS